MRTLAWVLICTALGSVAGCESKDDPMGGAAGAQAGEGGSSGSGAGGQGGQGGGGQSGGDGGQGGQSGSAGEAGAGGDSGASGGGGGQSGSGAVVPLAEVPGELAGAICEALEDCLGVVKLREAIGREECTTRVEAELEAGELAYIDASIGAGRVLYDPALLAECLTGIRGMGCAVATDTYPEACVQVIAGNVPEGGACVISAECAGTAFCSGRLSCPSTCQPLLEENDTCLTNDECGDDLICAGGACRTLAGEGEPCGGGSGQSCAFGLSCINFTDSQPGQCAPNAEVQAGDLGDDCSPTGTLCKEGLSCVPVSAEPEAWECAGPAERDGACRLALPGQCPVDQYCNASAFFADGACIALPAAGAPCVLNGLCAPGFACVAEGSAGVCREIVANGQSCTGDAACRSGRCDDGECAPPVVCQ